VRLYQAQLLQRRDVVNPNVAGSATIITLPNLCFPFLVRACLVPLADPRSVSVLDLSSYLSPEARCLPSGLTLIDLTPLRPS